MDGENVGLNSEQYQSTGAEALANLPSFEEHMAEQRAATADDSPRTEVLEDPEKERQAYQKQFEAIDYDIQQDLIETEERLQSLAPEGDEAAREAVELLVNNLHNDVKDGKYFWAYKSKLDGKVYLDDEADRVRDKELTYTSTGRQRREAVHRKGVGEEVAGFITETVKKATAATYLYGSKDALFVVGPGLEVAWDLERRTRMNYEIGMYDEVEGVLDGLLMRSDRRANEGMQVFGNDTAWWGAVKAQEKKAALIFEDFVKENPEKQTKYEQEKQWLEENKPEVSNALDDLSYGIRQVAGNDIESTRMNDIIYGCVINGYYRDAYVDKRGYICKDNPGGILDAEGYGAPEERAALVEAFHKNSASVSATDVQEIMRSPLAERYVTRPGVEIYDVVGKMSPRLKIEKSLKLSIGGFKAADLQADIQANFSEYLLDCVGRNILARQKPGEEIAADGEAWRVEPDELTESEKSMLGQIYQRAVGGGDASAREYYKAVIRKYGINTDSLWY